jgi:hypothetical protein
MKKIVLLTLFVLMAISAYSKEYAFKVLISKGPVQVNHSGAWNPVKPSEEIGHSNKIRLLEGGYIGLMHSSGRTLELKTKGIYDVANLENRLRAGQSGFTTKYANFIADNVITKDKVVSYDVVGSVTRGLHEVQILAPKQFKVLDGIGFEVSWISDTTKTYEVSVLNLYDEVLWFTEASSDRSYIDLRLIELEHSDTYILRVSDKDNSLIRGQVPFSLVDSLYEENLVLSLNKLDTDIDKESSLDQVMISSVYDHKHLPIYALSRLNKAEDLSPDNELFTRIKENYYGTVCKDIDK